MLCRPLGERKQWPFVLSCKVEWKQKAVWGLSRPRRRQNKAGSSHQKVVHVVKHIPRNKFPLRVSLLCLSRPDFACFPHHLTTAHENIRVHLGHHQASKYADSPPFGFGPATFSPSILGTVKRPRGGMEQRQHTAAWKAPE